MLLITFGRRSVKKRRSERTGWHGGRERTRGDEQPPITVGSVTRFCSYLFEQFVLVYGLRYVFQLHFKRPKRRTYDGSKYCVVVVVVVVVSTPRRFCCCCCYCCESSGCRYSVNGSGYGAGVAVARQLELTGGWSRFAAERPERIRFLRLSITLSLSICLFFVRRRRHPLAPAPQHPNMAGRRVVASRRRCPIQSYPRRDDIDRRRPAAVAVRPVRPVQKYCAKRSTSENVNMMVLSKKLSSVYTQKSK